MSRSTLWRVLAIAMPALAALAAAMPTVDLTFLLRAGSEILASGQVPTTDTWTFTALGTPWIDQQWGAEVLLQLVFGAAGWTGLAVLRAALVGLAFGLLFATARQRAPRLGPIAATVLVIAAFVVCAGALALRAQLFAIVLFAATLYLLAIRAERPRAVWLIPLLGLLWANLHGTFLFAPALCGLAWLADLFDARPARPSGGGVSPRGWALHRMLVVGLVAVAVTLVNPYGPAAWAYVANLTSNATIASRVSEWRPPSPHTLSGGLVWLSVVGAAVLVAVQVRTRRRAGLTAAIPWPALLTLALFGGFALASGRGTAWWPLTAVFVIAPWLQPRPVEATTTTPQSRTTPRLLRRLNLAIVVALVLAGVALLPLWRPVGPVGVPAATLTFAPQGISQALERAPIEHFGGRKPDIWNPQVWGSWLEFSAPNGQYSLDSRIELFRSGLWQDAETVATASPGWGDVLDRYLVDLVVTVRGTDAALDRALAGSSWSLIYSDCDGSIWARPTVVVNPTSASSGPITQPSCP